MFVSTYASISLGAYTSDVPADHWGIFIAVLVGVLTVALMLFQIKYGSDKPILPAALTMLALIVIVAGSFLYFERGSDLSSQGSNATPAVNPTQPLVAQNTQASVPSKTTTTTSTQPPLSPDQTQPQSTRQSNDPIASGPTNAPDAAPTQSTQPTQQHADTPPTRVPTSPDSPAADGVGGQFSTVDLMVITQEVEGGVATGACYMLMESGDEHCDEDQDGQVEFAEVPAGPYTLHQTADLGGGRRVDDVPLVVADEEGTGQQTVVASIVTDSTDDITTNDTKSDRETSSNPALRASRMLAGLSTPNPVEDATPTAEPTSEIAERVVEAIPTEEPTSEVTEVAEQAPPTEEPTAEPSPTPEPTHTPEPTPEPSPTPEPTVEEEPSDEILIVPMDGNDGTIQDEEPTDVIDESVSAEDSTEDQVETVSDSDLTEEPTKPVDESVIIEEEAPPPAWDSADIALITRDPGPDGYLITDGCYQLLEYGDVGCDENQDGQITFAAVPVGIYTVHQTQIPAGYEPIDDFQIVVSPTGYPTGYVVKQAPQQNAPDTRNVSIILIDDATGTKLPLDACVQIIDTGAVGCDQDVVDGQIDFLDVLAGRHDLSVVSMPAGYVITNPDDLYIDIDPWSDPANVFAYVRVVWQP